MSNKNNAKGSAAKINLTDDEVRAEVKKIKEQRAAAKAKRETPEYKAKAKEIRDRQKAKRDEVLARAAELGLKV